MSKLAVLLVRFSLELVLAIASIDTPCDVEVLFQVLCFEKIELLFP